MMKPVLKKLLEQQRDALALKNKLIMKNVFLLIKKLSTGFISLELIKLKLIKTNKFLKIKSCFANNFLISTFINFYIIRLEYTYKFKK